MTNMISHWEYTVGDAIVVCYLIFKIFLLVLSLY